MADLLTLENVSFKHTARLLVENVSFSLEKAQIVSIIGPNGAGKTTVVKIAAGLLEPTMGQVVRRVGLRIGYVPQQLQLDFSFPLTVERFLKLGQPTVGSHEILTELGITELAKRQLSALSGGELQRVLLARGVLRKPDLLILDEPAQGVDLMGQSELYELITRIRDRQHCGVLLVSHDLTMVMAQADKVICLNRHICCSGHPDKISQDPAFTALFGAAPRHLAFYTHHHDHAHGVGKQDE